MGSNTSVGMLTSTPDTARFSPEPIARTSVRNFCTFSRPTHGVRRWRSSYLRAADLLSMPMFSLPPRFSLVSLPVFSSGASLPISDSSFSSRSISASVSEIFVSRPAFSTSPSSAERSLSIAFMSASEVAAASAKRFSMSALRSSNALRCPSSSARDRFAFSSMRFIRSCFSISVSPIFL